MCHAKKEKASHMRRHTLRWFPVSESSRAGTATEKEEEIKGLEEEKMRSDCLMDARFLWGTMTMSCHSTAAMVG